VARFKQLITRKLPSTHNHNVIPIDQVNCNQFNRDQNFSLTLSLSILVSEEEEEVEKEKDLGMT